MKLIYFIETVIPTTRANSVHVMKICQAFKRNGVDITLSCDKQKLTDKKFNAWDKYGIIDRFDIVQQWIPSCIRNNSGRIGCWLSAFLKTRSKLDYNFAYGRSPYSLFFIKNRIPFIFESHTEPDKYNIRLERLLVLHRNCKGLVVISQTLKNKYMELIPELAPDKITVLHDCADIPRIKEKRLVELKNIDNTTTPIIGYLGHLLPGKCMEELIPLAKIRPLYTFHIVGGTSEWVNHWKKECDTEGINNIKLYGYINNSEIGSYYSAFDICILPFSNNIYVGKNKSMNIGKWISPLKLFEAMAYQKAILVSRIPTIEEVIKDGETGLFAEIGNPEDWATKLDRLLKNKDLRDKLGENAFCDLKQNYTWDKRAIRIIELLKR